jgi:CRP-like cAMP-binding protein
MIDGIGSRPPSWGKQDAAFPRVTYENIPSSTRRCSADLRLLEGNLEAVDLPVRKQLHARNRRIDHVYLLESGIASVVANGERPLEIGIMGREEMTGVPIVMGNSDRLQHETYVRVAGKGQRLSADCLPKALEASAILRQVFLQYAHAFMTQMADTALSNGHFKIEERLARWLLLAHDHVDHHMLGTARPGVTIALQELARRGGLSTGGRHHRH